MKAATGKRKNLQEGAEFRTRWEHAPFSTLLQDARTHDANPLVVLAKTAPLTPEGKRDLRGLSLSGITPGSFRSRCVGGAISEVDLRFSEASEGILFSRMNLVNCCFDQAVWWGLTVKDSTFQACTFSHAVLYAAILGTRTVFEGCTFDGLSTRGEMFSFGQKARFVKCSFKAVQIERADVHSVVFEESVLSGRFFECELRGKSYGMRRRLRTVTDLLFSGMGPATFLHCNLSQLVLEKSYVDRDVVFDACEMPKSVPWREGKSGSGK